MSATPKSPSNTPSSNSLTPDQEKAAYWERESCIEVVEKMRASFLSDEYAVGQPLSSVVERAVCGMIIQELRLRGAKGVVG